MSERDERDERGERDDNVEEATSEPSWSASTVRRLIVENLPQGVPGRELLERIHHKDHARFVALCHDLLGDELPRVRWAALLQLGRHGDPDDALAEETILASGDLQRTEDRGYISHAALFALGTIGTARAFTVLEHVATLGRLDPRAATLHSQEIALSAAALQARTDTQRQRVLELARDVFEPTGAHAGQQPEEALRTLVLLSHIPDEEDLLMDFLERTQDEVPMVIEVLGLASPRVLPRLRRFQAGYPQGEMIYRMCDWAIEEILHPLTGAEQLKRHVSLRGYLHPHDDVS